MNNKRIVTYTTSEKEERGKGKKRHVSLQDVSFRKADNRAQYDLVEKVLCKTSMHRTDKLLDVGFTLYFAATYHTGHVLKRRG